MPRTNWQDMARYEIAVPTKKIAVDFTAEVQSLIDKIIANIYESRILSNVRDTLLPRLMSGELAV
ncbi:MAG: type I restriction endonuclease subunit S [Candidatus Omnitrophica bacterium]|nr:type I restriction endonuclease subunit S [Candidatus Omnitrophota bacterium]